MKNRIKNEGSEQNRKVAIKRGTSAGKALKAFEEDTEQKVVSPNNFLGQIKEAKKAKK